MNRGKFYSSLATPSSLELHIGELVLHGFPPSDRSHISAAIQQELARLLTEHGIPPALAQGGTIGRLDGGAFEIKAGTPPRIIGAHIAQAIYGGLSHEPTNAIAGESAFQSIGYPGSIGSASTQV